MTRLAIMYAPGSASLRDLFALAQRREFELILVAGETLSPEGRRVLSAVGNLVAGAQPAPSIAKTLQERAAQGIVTFSDAELVKTADVCEILGTPGLSAAVARTVRSKLKQRIQLNSSPDLVSVPVASTRPPALSQGAAAIPLPAVVKPECGTASRDTSLVWSSEQLTDAIAVMHDDVAVVEAQITGFRSTDGDWLGDYVSVESAISRGEIVHLGITDRLPIVAPLREQGDVVPSKLAVPMQRRVEDIATAAIRALDIDDAVTHTEIKLTEHGGVVIEVNGRLGGYVDGLYRRAGATSPLEAAVSVALGEHVPPASTPRSTGAFVSILPPVGATRLLAIPDVVSVRSLAGVWNVEIYRRPGDEVTWRDGTSGRVMDVWVEADDHEELRRRLDRVRAFVEARSSYDAVDADMGAL